MGAYEVDHHYTLILVSILAAGIYSTSVAGGLGATWNALPATGMPSQELFFPGPVGWPFIRLFVVFFWPLGYLTWAGINRSFMASKTLQTARNSAIWAGGSYFAFILGITSVGLACFKPFPGLENPDLAFPKLITDYLPAGFAGFLRLHCHGCYRPYASLITETNRRERRM